MRKEIAHELRKVRWGEDREETLIKISSNMDELRDLAKTIRIRSGRYHTTELQLVNGDTGAVEFLKESQPYKPRKTKGRDYDLLGHIFSI
jgi:hypothetical protein|tara:strand:+ start:228 stop:497 length:270 start_codon:yes stop_codon:yes gene_type:complete